MLLRLIARLPHNRLLASMKAIEARQDLLLTKFEEIQKLQEQLIMTVDTFKDKLNTLSADLTDKFGVLKAEIDGLKNGGGATPEQLDALGAQVDSLDAAVKGFNPDAPAAEQPAGDNPAAQGTGA